MKKSADWKARWGSPARALFAKVPAARNRTGLRRRVWPLAGLTSHRISHVKGIVTVFNWHSVDNGGVVV
jgi:hypothetical protein